MKEHSLSEHSMSISEVQDKITRLPEVLAENPEAVTVTRHGKPVLTILPFDEYRSLVETLDSLLETIEILQDKELMAAFREGVAALERGETVAWEDVKEELGLE